jgi:hypothetical protein
LRITCSHKLSGEVLWDFPWNNNPLRQIVHTFTQTVMGSHCMPVSLKLAVKGIQEKHEIWNMISEPLICSAHIFWETCNIVFSWMNIKV